MQRVLSGGELQFVLELEGRDGGINVEDVEMFVNQGVRKDVSVSARQARFDADKELVFRTGSTILLEDDVENIERLAREELIRQEVGFTPTEWRVEVV